MIKQEVDRKTLINTDEDVDVDKITRETKNIMFGCTAVKGIDRLAGHYLVGNGNGDTIKYAKDGSGQKQIDTFSGHSMGVRSCEVNKKGTRLATCCEDHSLRIWDYDSCKAHNILAGHTDVVVSTFCEIANLNLDWRLLLERVDSGE